MATARRVCRKGLSRHRCANSSAGGTSASPRVEGAAYFGRVTSRTRSPSGVSRTGGIGSWETGESRLLELVGALRDSFWDFFME